jgi:hypothetical protein
MLVGLVRPTAGKIQFSGEDVTGMPMYRRARRGIGYEGRISADYLERLNGAYAQFFLDYDAGPLLIVNAASIDPLNNDADYQELLGAISRMRSGRLYYNPLGNAGL